MKGVFFLCSIFVNYNSGQVFSIILTSEKSYQN